MTRRELIEKKVSSLEASVETLTMQLKRLSSFYSIWQIKKWRKQRTLAKQRIKYYKSKLTTLGMAATILLLLLSSCSHKLPMPPKPPKLERNHYKR
jgi:hypothetical protein